MSGAPHQHKPEEGTVFVPSPILTPRLRADRIIAQIQQLQWQNVEPFRYLTRLLTEFGLPDVFDESAGGCAIWREPKLKDVLQTHCVKVLDECVRYKCLDTTCCGFVYLCVKYDTSNCDCSDQLASSISKHVIIDVEKKTIKARAKDLQSCVAILSVFTGVGACRVSPETTKRKQLADKAILLAEASQQDYDALLNTLQENLQSSRRNSTVM